ncbi:MAG: hypothetical protein DI620_02895 [Haemophilus parainfluenzae]|nr:MAG: hypothetical protein DI620_02895 [Haemophilus parainfluenzae]
MSEVLKANKREVSGTGASRRLRRAGEVPTILYGDTIKPLPLTVSQKDVFIALKKEEFHRKESMTNRSPWQSLCVSLGRDT